MIAWITFTALALLWFALRHAFHLRLVFWYDKRHIVTLLYLLIILTLFICWCALASRKIFNRSKVLGVLSLVPWVSMAIASFIVLLIISLFALLPAPPWEYAYFDSPEGTNTVIVIFGGDTGATSPGSRYFAYPMVMRGVYRRNNRNFSRPVIRHTMSPEVTWVSEREAHVHAAGDTLIVTF
jgi:hypothetical protein